MRQVVADRRILAGIFNPDPSYSGRVGVVRG
jgi:hypothetical protein